MTSTLKLYGSIALLVILVITGIAIVRWDSNRMKAQFEAGEMAERALWVAQQADANQKAQTKSNADTTTSEGVADKARSDAAATTSASSAANQTIVEKIVYAYRTAPPAACVPGPLPVGVLDGLNQARSAALGGDLAAPSGLQPTKRQRSTDAPNDG